MIPEVKHIQVLYRTLPVGQIQLDPTTGACVFAYDRSWLASGFSLSPTELPLQGGLLFADPDKFDGGFAIFEDSLPDGYGLLLLNRILRDHGSSLKELTPLQRLSLIGKSGMGALSYVPVLPGFQKQRELSDAQMLDTLQEEALKLLSEKAPGDASLLYYNSANSGGARPKAVLLDHDGTHWLVKFRHMYDPEDIGKTEYLYMSTAGACGIRIPGIKLISDRYFAVERFDIAPDGNRIHVATAAALLKTDFRSQNLDYTNLLALTGYLTQDPIQVEEMFRRMVFNIVAVNKDDHGKNFSFLCIDGKWQLAPAYDLTYSPKGTNGEHATSLFYNGNPGLDEILKAGTGIRIPESRCREIINEVESLCEKRLPIVNRVTVSQSI